MSFTLSPCRAVDATSLPETESTRLVTIANHLMSNVVNCIAYLECLIRNQFPINVSITRFNQDNDPWFRLV